MPVNNRGKPIFAALLQTAFCDHQLQAKPKIVKN